MKDKEKQIEEIETIIKSNLAEGSYANAFARKVAIQISEHYQPKLPEDSVVLSREEFNNLEQKIADLKISADFCKQQEEKIVDLSYDKFELKQEISEKDNKIALLEETIECIKFNVDFARKETAEKILDLVYERLSKFYQYDLDWKIPNEEVMALLEEVKQEVLK
jgi:hypothetical protein